MLLFDSFESIIYSTVAYSNLVVVAAEQKMVTTNGLFS